MRTAARLLLVSVLALTAFTLHAHAAGLPFLDGHVSGTAPSTEQWAPGRDVPLVSLSSGWTPSAPTLDGTISAAEWSNAVTYNISLSATPITLYLMNDAGFLYLAIDGLPDVVLNPMDSAVLLFDDEGGIPPLLSDGLWTAPACPATEGLIASGNNLAAGDPADDEFAGISAAGVCLPFAIAPGVTGAYSFASGHMVYETRIDLAASPLQAMPGQTFGAFIGCFDGGGAGYIGASSSTATLIDPSTYLPLTLALPPALAATNVVYGTLGTAGDLLMTVDPATGVASAIGATGAGALPGFAVSPAGEIFATSNSNGSGPSNLYRLDAATGQAFLVGATGVSFMDAIAFDRDGRLWGFGTAGLSDFFEIDPTTGVATLVAPVNEKLVGLACDPIDGTMYASATQGIATVTDGIYTVNTSTGALTLVGQTGLGGATPDIAFDVAGRLYGVKGGGGGGSPPANNLIAIDKTTGAGSVIGATGIDGISGLGSQAFLAQAPKNVLYGSTGSASGGDLLTIDPATGVGALVGNTGIPGVPALAIDSYGNMYGTVRSPGVAAELYRIDPATGASYLVGTIGYSFTDAMAVDRNGALWAISCIGPPACGAAWQLLRIDPTSATPTVVGPVVENLTGMAFDPDDGTLYASEGAGGDRIFTVDTATGATTLVGSTGTPEGLTDLVFDVHGHLYATKTVSGGGGGGPGASTLIRIDKTTGAGAAVGAVGFDGVSGAASSAFIAPVRTDVIYGTQGNSGDLLVTIDSGTGVATPVGHSGQALPGLAISPNGRMYATSASNPGVPAELYRLDPETGEAFHVGNTGIEFMDGIAFDAAGRLWGTGNFGGGANTTLFRINPGTGAVVPIGPNSVHLVGLAFDVVSGRLFGSTGGVPPSDVIVQVNTTTGASPIIAATGLGGATPDIAFDSIGRMFGVKGGGTGAPNIFIKIDPASAVGAIVGPTGINGISGLAAWNFGPSLDAPRGARPVAGTFLEAARPNPFSAVTELRFALQREGPVEIAVYSVTGQRVATLVNGTMTAGEHAVRWSGIDGGGRVAGSGIYYVRMRAAGVERTRTIVKLQ